jgi:Protein of unknown function (DUF3570)
LVLALACWPRALHADEVASALYVRNDDDSTTVVSPHARVNKRLGETTSLDVAYTVDVWTSASIDIATSASVRPVTEQRDEIDASVTQEFEDISLTGAYRFSTENDYTSHGATLATSYEFADNAATLDLSLTALLDVVGRSGDPAFARELSIFDARASLSQVVDTKTVVQGTYELAVSSGYHASPYRYVGIGGTGAGCIGAVLCLPEHTPDARLRHAIALVGRRALTDTISAGATYRFYFDGWGLMSHTLQAEGAWSPAEETFFALRYKLYSQGAADFYQARYNAIPTAAAFTTRDRELSPMVYHRIGGELSQGVVFAGGEKLTSALAVGGTFYSYSDYIGLSSVSALEVSVAFTLAL